MRIPHLYNKCFNSTLVQLKVMLATSATFATNSFQFYLSSIKSKDFVLDLFYCFQFQFYLSSIKSYSNGQYPQAL